MAYVICKACIDVKDTACVAVCPVDCIKGEAADEQLYINPEECIDCGACEPECPVNAIFEADQVPDDQKSFIEKNAAHFSRKE